MGQTWIAIGLGIGYAVSWIFMAPRLRRFSIAANDSITIPQYLTNRFLSKNKSLQILSAIIFLVAYTIYAASSIKPAAPCSTRSWTLIHRCHVHRRLHHRGLHLPWRLQRGVLDGFLPGMIMLAALLIAPCSLWRWPKQATVPRPARPCPTASFNFFTTPQDIISGLGWGLGYFGMPHIIIRFMSLKSEKELRKSSVIGISWTTII